MPSSPQKTPLLKQGNAQYNALSGDDERLRVLLEAWATLSHQVQQQIMLLPEGARTGRKTGDKPGMQTPAGGCTTAQTKSRPPRWIGKTRVSRTWWKSLKIHW